MKTEDQNLFNELLADAERDNMINEMVSQSQKQLDEAKKKALEIDMSIDRMEALRPEKCSKPIKYHMVECGLRKGHSGLCAAIKWGDRIVKSKE